MVTGLALSFTFATVALVYVINALGLPNGFARDLAIVVLFAFGITLLIPPIGDRVEAFASRLAPGPARFRGDGLRLGLGRRRQPRTGLRALRRADPGGGDRRLGGPGLHRRPLRRRPLVRGRIGDRPLPAADRRQAADPAAQPGARPGPDGAGRGDGARRDRDDRQPRHPLPDRDRERPARLPGQPDQGDRGEQGDLHRDRQGEPARGTPVVAGLPAQPAGQPADLRAGPRLHRHTGLVQHAGRRVPLDERPARQGRADRLLDLHLHQLHPHASLSRGLAAALRPRRLHRRRRPLAGVPVREGRGQRAGGDPPEPPHLPGRPGQRPGHLGRLGEPVLAGRLPGGRAGQHPRRALR